MRSIETWRRTVWLAGVFLISLSPALAWAAPYQEEFVDRFNNRFKDQDPRAGAQVLDGVAAFDESGDPFELDSLKGKHSVIVFGCLT